METCIIDITICAFPVKLVSSTGYVAIEPADIAQTLNEHIAGIVNLMKQSIAELLKCTNPRTSHTYDYSFFCNRQQMQKYN